MEPNFPSGFGKGDSNSCFDGNLQINRSVHTGSFQEEEPNYRPPKGDGPLTSQDQANQNLFADMVKQNQMMMNRMIDFMEKQSEQSQIVSAFGGSSTPFGDRWKKKPGIELERIKVPHFKGDISNWRNWWSIFREAVHNNPDYSKQFKIIQLFNSLEGKPLTLLNGVEKIGENYDIAIELLKKRFGNERDQKEKILMKLSNFPLSVQEDSVPSMYKFHDTLKSYVGTYESLSTDMKISEEVTKAELNMSLKNGILTKLPQSLLLMLVKEYTENVLHSMEYFLICFLKLTDSMNTISRYSGNKSQNQSQKSKDTGSSNQKSGTYLAYDEAEDEKEETEDSDEKKETSEKKSSSEKKTGESKKESSQKNSKGPYCMLCPTHGHYPSECTNFPTLQSRLDRIAEKNLCRLCLGEDHTFKECPAKKNPKWRECFYCKKRYTHHQCICYKKFKTPEEKTQFVEKKKVEKSETVKKKPEKNSVVQTAFFSDQSDVILATKSLRSVL